MNYSPPHPPTRVSLSCSCLHRAGARDDNARKNHVQMFIYWTGVFPMLNVEDRAYTVSERSAFLYCGAYVVSVSCKFGVPCRYIVLAAAVRAIVYTAFNACRVRQWSHEFTASYSTTVMISLLNVHFLSWPGYTVAGLLSAILSSHVFVYLLLPAC